MNEFFHRRPAVRFALLLTLGILVGETARVALRWVLLAEVIGLAAAAILLLAPSTKKFASPFLMLAVVGLGLLLHTRHTGEASGRWLTPSSSADSVRIAGVVESTPGRQGQWVSFLCNSSQIERADAVVQEARKILVLIRAKGFAAESIEVGDRIFCTGAAQEIPHTRNPGEFDYGRYLELNGVQGIVKVDRGTSVAIMSTPETFSIFRVVAKMQQRLYAILDELHPPQHASFLKGVILGYRGDISLDVKQSFVDTGTIHILAVSGSNVAVVALVFVAIFSIARLPPKWMVVATTVGLLWYMLVTGLSPSVIRATIMAAIILMAKVIERKADVFNAVAGAAVVLLLWNTNNLFDVGFQLSFAAVLSIVYFYPILIRWINRVAERVEEIKALDYLLKLFAVSAAAQLGTLPFTAYYFGRVSVVSLVANLLVVPVSGFNVLIGFAEMISFLIHPWIAQTFAALNGFLVWFLLGFVKFAASVPFAYIETSALPPLYSVLFYAIVFFLSTRSQPRISAAFLVLALVTLNGIVYADLVAQLHPSLRVTMIDVGQGDALLVKLPNGKRLLIDGGPTSLRYDAGERIVAPYLRRQGLKEIDAVVLSHAHVDHIGGVLYLLSHFSVRTLVESEQPSASALYTSIRASAEQLKVARRTVGVGDTIALDPSVRMYVLHPRMPYDSTSNLNNASIVLKIVFGRTSVLLAGDAETAAEEKMIKRYGDFVVSDILKVGHHGSKTSSSEAFLDLVSPATALVSVAAVNKFKHPSSEVVERYKSRRTLTLMTKNVGAIVFESNGERWKRLDWRNN